jgi:transglutaminase-like putative cysteine protease
LNQVFFLHEYLQETKFFDFNSPEIQNVIQSLELNDLSEQEKAIKLFYYVRDSIKYSVIINSFDPKIFQASYVLQQESSFCIPKAVALSTLARAVGIPSRIHFVDFVNHRLSAKLTELWGTNIMAMHCFTEFYLNNNWVKATASLDIETCNRHDFVSVEFDGINDSTIKEFDKKGRKHAEYVRDRGSFADVPINLIKQVMSEVYPVKSPEHLAKIFNKSTPLFIEKN